jgi:hypothetical protein
MGFLANGVEVQLAHQVFEPEVVRSAGRLHLEPGGFTLRKRLDAVSPDYLVKGVGHLDVRNAGAMNPKNFGNRCGAEIYPTSKEHGRSAGSP